MISRGHLLYRKGFIAFVFITEAFYTSVYMVHEYDWQITEDLPLCNKQLTILMFTEQAQRKKGGRYIIDLECPYAPSVLTRQLACVHC